MGSISEKFVDLVNKNRLLRFIINLKEMWMVLVLCSPFLSNPFSQADIMVTYDIKSFLGPATVISQAQQPVDSKGGEIAHSVERIASDPQIIDITVSNQSDRVIEDIEFQIAGLEYKPRVAVATDSLKLELDKQQIFSYEFDDLEKRVFFPNFTSMKPDSTIQLEIWGEYRKRKLFGDDVTMEIPSGNVKVSKSQQVVGSRRFFASHLEEIALLIVVLTMLVGIRRYVK